MSPEPLLIFGNGLVDRPFTMAIWVKFTQSATHNGNYVISKYINASSDGEYTMGHDQSTNETTFIIYDDSTASFCRIISSGAGLSTGTWHHIVYVYNGAGGSAAANGMDIYANGC